VVLAKNHEKPILEMCKWSYKMLVSNDLLRIIPQQKALFRSSRHVQKISALNFSISSQVKLILSKAKSQAKDKRAKDRQ
jgi:hypothetical protein